MARDQASQHDVVASGNLCNDLLHKPTVRPRWGESSPVVSIAGREARPVRELVEPINGDPDDDLGTPPLGVLADQDHAADVPVHHEHRDVRRQHDAKAFCSVTAPPKPPDFGALFRREVG